MLILPGFATDILGILLVFPLQEKLLLKYLSKNFTKKNKQKK